MLICVFGAIQIPAGKASTGDKRVQFHSDKIRMLVVHETQLAIYDASKMERIQQWIPQVVLPAPISYATYSCNNQSIYATFFDGNTGVFDAESLKLRCHIASSVLVTGNLKGKPSCVPACYRCTSNRGKPICNRVKQRIRESDRTI